MRKAIRVVVLGGLVALSITLAWAAEQKDLKKVVGSLSSIRLYPIPKDPNRLVVRIPQAPKPLVPEPQTNLIQKPGKKELPR